MSRRIAPVIGLTALVVGVLPVTSALAGPQARRTPALSISTDHGHYAYGATIRLTVHLGATGSGRTVTITEKVPGKAASVIDRDDAVDGSGNLVGQIAAARNATYSVSFAGNSGYAPRTVSARAVSVAAGLVAVMDGRYGTDGRYSLFHTGRSARYDVGVAPNKSRQRVTFPVQSYYHHRWRTVSDTAVALNGRSLAGTAFTARKGLYRVRAEYHGDSTNGGRRGAWSYLKFG